MSSPIVAEVIDDPAALAALAPEWWELWRRIPEATPFQTPGWLLPWWWSFAPGEILAVAVRRGTRLVGLAPFYIERGPVRRMLPIGMSLSDHLDVLLDPAEAEASMALVDGLWRQRDRWDLLNLEELAPDAVSWRLQAPPACIETVEPQSRCPVLVLPESGSAFRSGLTPRKRRKLAMAGNRAARRGGAQIERVDPTNAAAVLAALFVLHDRRWESRGERGVFADPRVRGFFARAAEQLLAAGLLRLFALVIEGRRAGVYCGFRSGERAFAWLSGFDPDFASESPGVLLVAQAIEDAINEGAREFHFLRGGEAYKYEWGAIDRWNRRRSFRRST